MEVVQRSKEKGAKQGKKNISRVSNRVVELAGNKMAVDVRNGTKVESVD